MFPGLNPKKMQAVMKQMGISQQQIPANKVIIEKQDGNIIIENPSITKINMQGQTNFQISGEVSEEDGDTEGEGPLATDEDIKIIMEKCNCLEQEAKMALEKANGDLTEAILSLS
jgi:nascent polypeptide-associated complex subunit alpha